MSRKISISKRINAILALLIVFLLVLATNRIDQRNFDVARECVTEVYKDRVLVQGYIFSISNVITNKKLSLKDSSSQNFNPKENERIDQLLDNFEATKLTISEGNHLKKLRESFETLTKLEAQQNVTNSTDLKEKKDTTLKEMSASLIDLSKIQISASKDLTHSAQKSLEVSELLSNLEIIFLIITGIAIQFILFYRVRKTN
ncbi:hypothetical protein QO206_02395 [Leeuwenhoekiella aequorea]|uniref:hypothetical protein n=1 Tax=Leeuwenhoekiella TaxID=283735 RepID=UPI00352F399A|tara:strand:+ start:886 stop:1491 length:606 start_codon:yes stop_codon:yes gene_type:complete